MLNNSRLTRFNSKLAMNDLLILFIPLIISWFGVVLANNLFGAKFAFVAVIVALLTAFVSFASMREKRSVLSIDRISASIYLLLIIWMSISAVLTAINYLPVLFVFAAFIPLYYFSGNNGVVRLKSSASLYTIISLGLTIVASVACVAMIFMFPLKKQYAGFFVNPNSFSMFLSFVLCGVLNLVSEIASQPNTRFKTVGKICLVLLLGIVLAMQFFTNSRAGSITAISSILLMTAHIITSKQTKGQLLLVVFSLFAAVFIILTLPKFSEAYFAFKNAVTIQNIQQHESSLSEETIESTSPNTGDDAVSQKQYQNEDDSESSSRNVEESSKGNEGAAKDNQLLTQVMELHKTKTQTSSASFLSLFGNRLGIYEAYWNNLNLFGNGPKAQVEMKAKYGLSGNTAHNTFLEFGYDMGIPAGILFLAFVAYSFFKTLILFFKQTYCKESLLLPVLIVTCYSLYTLVESIYWPGSMQTWLYLMVQGHVFTNTRFGNEPKICEEQSDHS